MRKHSGYAPGRRIQLVHALILSIALTSSAGSASAQETAAEEGRTLAVSGTGEVSLDPELARIQVGVQSEGRDATETVESNTEQAQRVREALAAFEIAPRDIRTTGFTIQPRRRHEPERRGETYYVVQNTVLVTVRNLDRIGTVLDAVSGAGANTIAGLEFDVADRSEARTQALEAAIRDARDRAAAAASAAGVELGAVRSIRSGGAPEPPKPVFEMRAAAAEAEVPISPGRMELSAQVQVVYEIR